MSSITFRQAVCTALFGISLFADAALAQSVGSGAFQGRVTDETGGALPGTTVSVSGPALQVPKLSSTTDADGSYRFASVPPGVYTLTFELSGFNTVVRSDLRLNVGFVARVDAVLKVGGVRESVTVSGQSPVVDVTTTAGGVNFTKETLQTIPTTKSMWQVLAMTPGVRMADHDVGGSKIGQQLDYRNYGTFGQVTPMIEGINTRQDTTRAGFYYDYSALEEAQIKAVAADAEVALPGTTWIAVVKSGGNDFHGSLSLAGQSKAWQSTNLDDALRAQGVTIGNSTKWVSDASGDLGGRLVRDKLWFYGALHDQRRHSDLLGFVRGPGPDGVFLTSDDEPAEAIASLTNQTAKVSFQPSSKYKMIGFVQRNAKYDNADSADRFRPLDSTAVLHFDPIAWKGELQGTPSSSMLFNVLFGRQYYLSARDPRDGVDRPGNPSRWFRDTGLFLGPAEPQHRPRERWQNTASLSWYPAGSFGGHHSLKTGYVIYFERMGREYVDKASGNYLLVFDRVGQGPRQPVEIQTFNYPIQAVKNRMTEYSGYVKDTWSIGRRLTANVGVRLERYHSYIDPQEKAQGQFGSGGAFPAVDVLTWVSAAPRIGVAYDPAGNARTVVKAAYGLFNHTMGDDYAEPYNRNGLVTSTYRWRDADGNGDYAPGEVNLDTNGPDFISISGSANNINNTALKQPRTHEFSLALERELMANFGARALYVYKRQVRLYDTINVLRPFSAFNIPLTRRDPGPDGILGTGDDAGSVTIYDYDAAFRGSRFVGSQRSNTGDPDSYNNLELTLNKRMSHNWEMLASYGATKNHRQLKLIPENPNDRPFRIDTTWDWQFKLTGSYMLPAAFRVAAFYQHFSGKALQRTYIFRSADPDGGAPLRQLSTVTLRLAPLGSERLPQQKLLNLRLSKEFRLGAPRLSIDADLFNALNTNVALDAVAASGPSFGRVTSIMPPRIGRVGATITF
jgi:hypothetical protein